MRVDPALPRAEKCTLVLEAIGDDKVRVNHQSLDSPLVILADQALEIIAAGKPLHSGRPNTSTSTWAGWWTPVTVGKPSRGQCNSVT